MSNDEIAAKYRGADSPEEGLPFLDALSAEHDRNLNAAHRAASERSWVARTPVGLAFLCYEDVLWLLRDERWRELGADALVAARAKSPRDDLISGLAAVEKQGPVSR